MGKFIKCSDGKVLTCSNPMATMSSLIPRLLPCRKPFFCRGEAWVWGYTTNTHSVCHNRIMQPWGCMWYWGSWSNTTDLKLVHLELFHWEPWLQLYSSVNKGTTQLHVQVLGTLPSMENLIHCKVECGTMCDVTHVNSQAFRQSFKQHPTLSNTIRATHVYSSDVLYWLDIFSSLPAWYCICLSVV